MDKLRKLAAGASMPSIPYLSPSPGRLDNEQAPASLLEQQLVRLFRRLDDMQRIQVLTQVAELVGQSGKSR